MSGGLAIRLLLAVVLLLPIAGDVPRRPVAPGEPSIHGYAERDPTCQAWTDGCRTCTPGLCSNIGIACQPTEIRCTQR